ncbi:unnamed protein product [Microthlaspi erraticum]|uniref:Myb-like domain-containing protein n=1 Tax=Microthlaspi erraticum TaxID=1685480 RepID=A0A6D2IEF4_9BRAS|nr:unnamed protein product [Microthlaspi erraticum]
MFDGGVPEQIHRFVASPPPPPPLPPHQPAAERSLPFPVSFASSYTNHQAQHMLSLDIHHHHHHHHHDIKDSGATSEWMSHTDHGGDNHHPWCSDEVLALLRFRSTVENWFPEFTWEHTSRKLAEVGFKRSPQECKEKFEEEERRYFNSNNNTNDHHINNYNKGSYRTFSEVEEFYHHGHDDENVSSEVGDNQTKRNDSLEGKGNVEVTGQDLLEDDKRDHQGQVEEASMENKVNSIDNAVKVGNAEGDAKSSSSSSLLMIIRDKKKRKRKKDKERFGVLKGFCEGLVRNMIAQQEEMHKKLLEDMVKKEEEKMAREEAWKKQEMERLNKEVEIRAQEQAMASDRNTNIINFISKFTDHEHHIDGSSYKVQSPSPSQDSSLLPLPQTQSTRKFQTSSSPLSQTLTQHTSLEPISAKALKTKTQNQKPPKSDEKSDLGKRWPRDEVLALINIRRGISSTNDDDHHKDGNSLSSSSKAVPLWERISKKMLETGYKRSAKRCKEKWENINKYFRKTKDVNKKRPLDSRTCPYFHQLTALYSQPSTGTTTSATATATSAGDLEPRPEENRVGSGDLDIPAAMHVVADGANDE